MEYNVEWYPNFIKKNIRLDDDLSFARLKGRFYHCNVDRARFNDAHLDIDIQSSEISGTSFTSITSFSFNFEHVKINLSDFDDARLGECEWSHSEIRDTSFNCIYIVNLKATSVLFENVSFDGASLTGVFRGCSFNNTNFAEADLSEVSFINCMFDGCSLRNAIAHPATYRDQQMFINCDFGGLILIYQSHNRFRNGAKIETQITVWSSVFGGLVIASGKTHLIGPNAFKLALSVGSAERKIVFHYAEALYEAFEKYRETMLCPV